MKQQTGVVRLSAAATMLLMLLLSQSISTVTMVAGVAINPRHCRGTVKHVHIAVGRDPTTEMTVSFTTKWAFPGVEAPIAGILVGRRKDQLGRFVREQELPLTYNTSLPFEHWGHYYAPYQHHITIGGLEPDTTYFYQVVLGDRGAGIEELEQKALTGKIDGNNLRHRPGNNGYAIENTTAEDQFLSEQQMNDEEEDFNRRHRMLAPPPYDGHEKPCPENKRIRTFKTAPETDQDMPVTFAIVGDLGQFEFTKNTVIHMKRHKKDYDAALLIGDIAYTENDERRWETFFDFMDDFTPFDQMPLMIATGNHDIEKQANRREVFRGYEHRFRMPRVRPPQLGLFDGPMGDLNMDAAPYPMPYEWGNAYYSFEYGSAYIIVISAYSNMDPDSTQYNWLSAELESVDRTRTPWLLISMHVPIYNTFDLHHHDLQIVAAREHVQPLLIEHKANMIFSGHIHAYQRTGNIIEDAVRHPHGPIHITIGAGGRACNAPFQHEIAEEWIEQRDATMYGYGKFQIHNRTDAEWVWIPVAPSDKRDYNFIKHNDTVHLPSLKEDSVWVKNQFHLANE